MDHAQGSRSDDRSFLPPRCPLGGCSASVPGAPFRFRRRGTFRRALDGRLVQRFECLICGRSFSSQTFRLDYRLRRPDTLLAVFVALASKTTLRKTARSLGVGRSHVVRRFARLAHHCHDFHAFQLARAVSAAVSARRSSSTRLETTRSTASSSPSRCPS
ncbi:MAG: hypothetical protein R3F34_09565 [Planctomycetota bacterium]